MCSKVKGKRDAGGLYLVPEISKRSKKVPEAQQTNIAEQLKASSEAERYSEEDISLEWLYGRSTLDLQLAAAGDEERDENSSARCLLVEGITLEVFKQVMEKDKEDQSRGRLMFADGSIFIYEIPTRRHERAGGAVIASVGHALLPTCYVEPSPRLTSAPGGWSKEPDAAITPHNKPKPGPANLLRADDEGGAWPNVILEVAASDRLGDVLGDAARWLGPNTTVRVMVAIMEWAVGADGRAQMVALRFRRNAPQVPDRIISFGSKELHHATVTSFNRVGWPAITGFVGAGGICNAAAMPAYQMPIARGDVFHSVPGGPPVGAPVNYDIDLFVVKRNILG